MWGRDQHFQKCCLNFGGGHAASKPSSTGVKQNEMFKQNYKTGLAVFAISPAQILIWKQTLQTV